MIDINGIAHIQITAGIYEIARAFYMQLLPFLGLKQVLDNEYGYYCVGSRTGVLISKPAPEHEGERFVQSRVGLHHVCFRARSREDIDAAHVFVKALGAPVIRAPQGKTAGRRATTPSCSKTRTASVSRSISFLARASSTRKQKP